MRIDVTPAAARTSTRLAAALDDVRAQAEAFVFLSGGASRMRPEDQQRLSSMFAALGDLARRGRRFAVAGGGTQAGIMQAAGEERRASGGAFPLIGIPPAREVPPQGRTPLDPNHSLIVAVDDPALPADREGWGSETPTMYEVFARLGAGRPSVTVVANGGDIVLDEVAANVQTGRRMILVEGSGRAADALVALLRGTAPGDDEIAALRDRARDANLVARPDLFDIVPLSGGAAALRDALERELFADR